MTTEDIIKTRHSTHGNWADQARIAGELKTLMRKHIDAQHIEKLSNGQLPLSPARREALDMILTKVARIIAGDASFPDHWDDIAGYAQLGKQ